MFGSFDTFIKGLMGEQQPTGGGSAQATASPPMAGAPVPPVPGAPAGPAQPQPQQPVLQQGMGSLSPLSSGGSSLEQPFQMAEAQKPKRNWQQMIDNAEGDADLLRIKKLMEKEGIDTSIIPAFEPGKT